MLKELRKQKVRGVIIHKIDRGTRNLRDWAMLGELVDEGVEIHFAAEELDLSSRGGRLAADIQAVIAADFIRNLRDEVRKGFYGRIKQGLYPLPAPLGYLDCGKGKTKEIDPATGPLIRLAFELYACGRYSLQSLGNELHRLGLRNRKGERVSRAGLSCILRNRFYSGMIHLKKADAFYKGNHTPLVLQYLFEQVQSVLRSKVSVRRQRHIFPFQKMLHCRLCGTVLTGEKQKEYVYYRCHTRGCSSSIRADVVEQEFSSKLLLFKRKDKDAFDAAARDFSLFFEQNPVFKRQVVMRTLDKGWVEGKRLSFIYKPSSAVRIS